MAAALVLKPPCDLLPEHQKVVGREPQVSVLLRVHRWGDSPDSPTRLTACQKVEQRVRNAVTCTFIGTGKRARRDSNPQPSDP